MVYRHSCPWYFDLYQWYMEPQTHGILIHYPWYFDPLPMVHRPPYPWYFDLPTHGISNPIPMVFLPPAYLLIRSDGSQNTMGVQNTMTPVLSSFMTYHRICNQINMTSTTSGAGTAYLSRAPKFSPGF